MLHVSPAELEKAFRRHVSSGQGDAANDSKLLLLVYAVECGLKRLLLRQRGLKSTHRLDDDDLTHDLNSLLRKLGGRPSFPSIPIGKLDGRASQVSVDQLHEALRYGVSLADRSRVADIVSNLILWIREELQ